MAATQPPRNAGAPAALASYQRRLPCALTSRLPPLSSLSPSLVRPSPEVEGEGVEAALAEVAQQAEAWAAVLPEGSAEGVAQEQQAGSAPASARLAPEGRPPHPE